MLNFSEPVTPAIIVTTIMIIFVVIGIGIYGVKKFKKES